MTSQGPPDRIGRYVVERELGRGAMGIVVLARDPRVDRLVAIKTLDPALASDAAIGEELKHRFLTEARAAGRLNHPGIVSVLDADEEPGGRAYLVMEYVEGVELRALAAGGLEPARVVELVEGIADALQHAHERGVIHRDVKPANVLVDAKGRPKLTDFGVARLGDSTATRAGQLLGSPAYMAPEQIRGLPVSPATDTFSLAVMAYEMLARRRPFVGGDLVSTTHAILNEQPERPSALVGGLPRPVDDVLLRALAKDPAARPSSIAEFARELRAALEAQAAETLVAGAVPGSTVAIGARPRPDRRVLIGAALLAVVLAAAGLAAWLASRGDDATDPEREAVTATEGEPEPARKPTTTAPRPTAPAAEPPRKGGKVREAFRDVADTVRGKDSKRGKRKD